MTDFPCVLEHRHDPDRLRRSLDGMLVCAGCLHSLEQALAELPGQFDQLATALSPRGGAGPMVSGTRERQLPIDPTVADHREHIARVLASWTMMIAEERGMTPPASGCPPVTCRWLLVHLRWACAQDWVDDFAAELRALRGRANALLYPSGRRRVRVGPCIEARCVGLLTATIVPADDLLPSSVDCDVEPGHTWSTSQWHTLGRRLHGAAGFDERAGREFLTSLQAG